MAWEVELTETCECWLLALEAEDYIKIAPVIDKLEEVGPTLGRPSVERIKASRHHNMKELRSRGGHIRVLFAFDAERSAILLLGGDKTDNWKGWYETNIPVADELFSQHQEANRAVRGKPA